MARQVARQFCRLRESMGAAEAAKNGRKLIVSTRLGSEESPLMDYLGLTAYHKVT